MPAEMKEIHKDLESLKRDLAFIKHILSENYELSVSAKKQLKRARKTDKSKYIGLNEI